MLDDKLRAELEQSQAALTEMLPPLWHGLYQGCVKEGFTPQEALRIVETYILATLGNNI